MISRGARPGKHKAATLNARGCRRAPFARTDKPNSAALAAPAVKARRTKTRVRSGGAPSPKSSVAAAVAAATIASGSNQLAVIGRVEEHRRPELRQVVVGGDGHALARDNRRDRPAEPPQTDDVAVVEVGEQRGPVGRLAGEARRRSSPDDQRVVEPIAVAGEERGDRFAGIGLGAEAFKPYRGHDVGRHPPGGEVVQVGHPPSPPSTCRSTDTSSNTVTSSTMRSPRSR